MKRHCLILLSLFIIFQARGIESADTAIRVGSELPELDVVSIKQADNLSKQAISATVLKTEEVNLNNIVSIKTMSDLVPNFFMPSYGSRITSTIYVRGIGARMDQPAVGLNIDNLPVLNKDSYDLDLADISEIQMLRGPQSVLYGRNTMMGLINIRTLSPFDWQGVRILTEIASKGSFRLQGGWYHKFNPSTGFSATLSLSSKKGFYKNMYNDAPVGDDKGGSLRLKFEWLPKNNISLINTLSSSLFHQSGYAYEYVGNKEINYNDTCFYHRFLLNDALTVRFQFTGWSLSSITSVQHIDDNMTLDQDFLPLPYFTLTQKKRGTDFTEEVLARRSGSHDYKWLAGVFGFYRHLNMHAPVTFKDVGIDKLIESHRNEANPYYPILWDSRNFVLNSDFKLPSFGVALYHQSDYGKGNWKFSAGLRLDYEKIYLDYRSQTSTSYTIYRNPDGNLSIPFSQLEPFRNIPIDIDETGKLSTDFLTLLPKISILYELPKSSGNVYISFSKGYKAGGFNTQMFSDVLQQKLMNIMGLGAAYAVEDIVRYKPESSWNYEVGTHLDLHTFWQSIPRLTLDLTLYYIDCRNQQLTSFPDGTTTGRIMTNAGKTRSYGGEISLGCNPWSTLDFNASFGYTNAKFVKYNDGIADYAGNRVPYSPSSTLFLQCLYSLTGNRLGENRVIFDVNMRGTGSIYWNEENSLHQPFYALLGASVTLAFPKWEVQVWGKNLTDTKYNTFYFMSMGNEFLQRGDKLSAGVTLRLNF